MKIQILLLALASISIVNAQDFASNLKLFTKKSIPYTAPTEMYSDMYLEDGEESTIPYKEISKDFYTQIGGYEGCRCSIYAVDQIPLKNGYIGLIVYELEIVEQIPYEQGGYAICTVDAQGKPVDYLRLSTDFYTSNGDNRSYTEAYKSELYFSDADPNQIVIKKITESGESINGEFGQEIKHSYSHYFKISDKGEINEVTEWVEEY